MTDFAGIAKLLVSSHTHLAIIHCHFIYANLYFTLLVSVYK